VTLQLNDQEVWNLGAALSSCASDFARPGSDHRSRGERRYFKERVEPLIDGDQVQLTGEVNIKAQNLALAVAVDVNRDDQTITATETMRPLSRTFT
jgi:hypothetical protein